MKSNQQFEAVDLLCGSGGMTEGMHRSDYFTVIQGLNHDQHAIETNSRNHKDVEFVIADLYKSNEAVIKKADVLAAGIECTNHSKAKGGSSRDPDSRAMANEIFRYIKYTGANIVIIENVVEFLDWGPLIPKRDSDGKIIKITRGKNQGKPVMIPDPKKKGQYFHKWCYKMQYDYGFKNYSKRVLNAADYGAPTSRKRLFLLFTKEGWEIEWPEPTHTEKPGMFGLEPWIPCRECIDLNNHGNSIFGRTRKNGDPNPLVENTLKRIAYGIKKYGPGVPFIAKSYRSEQNVSSIDDPLHTITTKDRHALITTETFYTQHYHGASNYGSIDEPLKTIVTKDEKALVTVEKLQFIDKYFSGEYNVSSIDKPLGTITTNTKSNLVTCDIVRGPFEKEVSVELLQFISKHFGGNHASSLDKPLHTITTKDHNTLISCYIGDGTYLLDVKMRWLNPRELAMCQGFGEDYILTGTKAQQTKGIGNSIPPQLITAISNSMGKANLHNI